jgi:hypothetical protein
MGIAALNRGIEEDLTYAPWQSERKEGSMQSSAGCIDPSRQRTPLRMTKLLDTAAISCPSNFFYPSNFFRTAPVL